MPLMNSFYKHHRDSIRWHYRCFDRILLNGLIQPFQQPERVVGFFNTYRQLYPVSRHTLRDIAEQFQRWLKGWSEKRNIPVAEAPKGRRDDFVEAYFRGANPDQVVVIVKAREPARIMTAIGDSKTNRWHLQITNCWVVQYNFYINDRQWGRMFVPSRGNGGRLRPRVWLRLRAAAGGNRTPDGIVQLESEANFPLSWGTWKRTQKNTLYGVVFQKLMGPCLRLRAESVTSAPILRERIFRRAQGNCSICCTALPQSGIAATTS